MRSLCSLATLCQARWTTRRIVKNYCSHQGSKALLSTIFRGKGQESSQSRHKYLLAIIHHSTAQHSTAQLATIVAGFEPTASLQGTRTRNRCTTRAKQLSSFLRFCVFITSSRCSCTQPCVVALIVIRSLPPSSRTRQRLHATSPRQRALAYLSRLACYLLRPLSPLQTTPPTTHHGLDYDRSHSQIGRAHV